MLPKPRTVYQQTETDCLLAGPAPGKWTRRGQAHSFAFIGLLFIWIEQSHDQIKSRASTELMNELRYSFFRCGF